MAKKRDIWGGLQQILGVEDKTPMSLDKTDIDGLITPKNNDLIFDTQEEYEKELLKLQQKSFLNRQFKKVTNDAYQKSVYYETTRQSAYLDYEQMEFFPEIATALNIISEEATTLFEDGKLLKIESNSSRIKNILTSLFEGTLQINTTLPYWTRNTCKYGDCFVYLKTVDGKGITRAVQLKNFEITRKDDENILEDEGTKFHWNGHNEVFNEWQIAHFRLVTNDKYLPYGTSILDKVRKTYKMLTLAEDAMMVYRISRAPERRVFKIDVGNMDADDIDGYISKISDNLKRTAKVNTSNGQIDYRYNVLTQDEDYFIPTRGNQNQTVIDTLAGATNLSDIGDIEFLQGKLFSGLQVPKSFLGYDEASGDGKSLSMQDIRFARTVNKVQQSMLMELNKIAIIHLYLLGFKDDLNEFKLSLANPSKQSKILDNEILSSKLENFTKATTKTDSGFAPMSFTEASKIILGKSDDEIKLTMQQQYIESFESSKISDENIGAKNLSTGLFDSLDRMYTVVNNNKKDEEENGNEDENGDMGNDFGGDFGGGSFGDFDMDDDADSENSDDDDDASTPLGGLQEKSINLKKNFLKNKIENKNLL